MEQLVEAKRALERAEEILDVQSAVCEGRAKLLAWHGMRGQAEVSLETIRAVVAARVEVARAMSLLDEVLV